MRSTGQCPVCQRQVGLTSSRGLIRTHVTGGERCPGTGLEPVGGSRGEPLAAAEPPTTFAAGWEAAAVPEEPVRESSGGKLLAVLAAGFLVALVVGALWDDDAPDPTAYSEDSSGYQADVDHSGRSDPDPYAAPATDDAYGLPESVVEDTFLSSIHASGLSVYGPDDQQIELAHAMCGALDRGAGFEDAMGVLMNSGYGSDAAGAYFGIAVASFCPEHSTW